MHIMQSTSTLNGEALRAHFAPGSEWAKLAGERIRKGRKSLYGTLEAFSDIVGCDPSVISRIETGQVVPRQALMASIAFALNREIEDLWPMPTLRVIGEVAA